MSKFTKADIDELVSNLGALGPSWLPPAEVRYALYLAAGLTPDGTPRRVSSTFRRVPLVEFARLNGLSWGQAWRKVLRNEVPDEQVKGKWFVDMPDPDGAD